MKKLITAGSVMILSLLVLTACVGGPAAPTKSPEDMVKEAFVNSMDVKSNSFEAKIDLDIDSAGDSIAGLITMSGKQDMNDVNEPKFSIKMGFKGTMSDYPEQSGEGELMMDGKTIYFVLNNVTDFDGALPEEMVAPFIGQWYSMPVPEDAVANFGMIGDPEQLEAAKQLFLDNFFLKDIEYVGTEGSDYKYSAKLDEDNFVAYMKASAEMSGETISDNDIQDFKDALKNIESDFVVYVDSEGVLLSGIDGSMVIDVEGEGGTINFEVKVDDFGEAVSIDVPENATEFNPMMLLGPAMMMQPGMDDTIDPGVDFGDDLSGTMTEEEINAMMKDADIMMDVEATPEGGVSR